MTNIISESLAQVDEAITIHKYTNGYMLEISGMDSNEEWANVKIIAPTEEELFSLITKAYELPIS